MSQKKKNNIIIGSLCAVVLLMVVGYAAFQSVLNITGTSKVSSNWNILITNIETKNIVGGASNASEPTGKGALTATFNTNLVSPGDSIEYDITVSNQGTLNAVLEKITVSDTNNPAIKFTTTGIKQGDPLNAGGSAVLTVKVEYSNSVTSQPDNTKSEFTVTLDYAQNDGTVIPANNEIYTNYHLEEHKVISAGDSVGSLVTSTTDYSTLGNVFLKHVILNNLIESSETCIIKDGTMYCFKPNEYEGSKEKALEIFGTDNCTITEWDTSCSDSNNINVEISDGRVVTSYTYENGESTNCYVWANGTSAC